MEKTNELELDRMTKVGDIVEGDDGVMLIVREPTFLEQVCDLIGIDGDHEYPTVVLEWIKQAKILMNEQHRMIAVLHPEIIFGTPENPKKMGDLTPEVVGALRREVYAGDAMLDDVADQIVDERGITIDNAWALLQRTYQYGAFTEDGLVYELNDGTTITRPFRRD